MTHTTITDEAGRLLAQAAVFVDDDGNITIRPARASRQALLQYYFRKHGRNVAVEVHGIRIPGVLHTRMDGTQRLWWMVPARAQAGEDESAPTRTDSSPAERSGLDEFQAAHRARGMRPRRPSNAVDANSLDA